MPMPCLAAVVRQERMTQNDRALAIERTDPESLIRGLPILISLRGVVVERNPGSRV